MFYSFGDTRTKLSLKMKNVRRPLELLQSNDFFQYFRRVQGYQKRQTEASRSSIIHPSIPPMLHLVWSKWSSFRFCFSFPQKARMYNECGEKVNNRNEWLTFREWCFFLVDPSKSTWSWFPAFTWFKGNPPQFSRLYTFPYRNGLFCSVLCSPLLFPFPPASGGFYFRTKDQRPNKCMLCSTSSMKSRQSVGGLWCVFFLPLWSSLCTSRIPAVKRWNEL